MIRILLALVALLALALGYALWRAEAAESQADKATARAEYAEAIADTLVEVIEGERVKAAQLAAIAATYEQEKQDVQAAADRVVADLRADNLRLQKRWSGCPAVPETAATAGKPDAAADDRAASAGRIILAGAACDAQVRGLQAVILADRSKP